MSQKNTLLSYEFIALSLTALFGFCNIAIFYSFHHYLEKIGIPAEWVGLLLALEPLSAFLLRPLISTVINAGNAIKVIGWSLVGIGGALLSYPAAGSVLTLALVRIVHGAAFVVLVSAVVTLLVLCIPPEQSARGFGLFSLTGLVPYAVIPPVTELVLSHVGDEAVTYAMAAVFVLPSLACLPSLGRRMASVIREHESDRKGRITFSEVRENLRTPGVGLLLSSNFCFFVGSTIVFYFMKDYSLELGLSNPGAFFMVATAATIATRLGAGPFLDRVNARSALVGTGLVLCLAFFAFGMAQNIGLFLGIAALYGACLGVVMPLLSSSMFLTSRPAMRGLNTNLMLFMMDAGYVVGPLVGAGVLGMGLSHAFLFGVCAVWALIGVCFLAVMGPVTVPGVSGAEN